MNQRQGSFVFLILFPLALLGSNIPAVGVEIPDLDARLSLHSGEKVAPTLLQVEALEALQSTAPKVMVRVDPRTGATRALFAPGGRLTPPQSGRAAEEVISDFLGEYLAVLGLVEGDLETMVLTDRVESSVTGVTHFYFRQHFQGIAVYNGLLQVHVDAEGRIIGVENTFLPRIAEAAVSPATRLERSAARSQAEDHLAALGLLPRVTKAMSEGELL